MRCLIVDQDERYAASLKRAFNARGIRLDTTYRADDAEIKIGDVGYHALVLNTDVSSLPSIKFIQQLRSDGCEIPIILVSLIENTPFRIEAFEAGADDCVTFAVDPDELIARIHNVMRRRYSHSASSIEIGELKISLNAKSASFRGVPLEMTRREYQTLEFLALRKGRKVSKEQLMEDLFSGLNERDVKTMDVYIHKVRKRLTAVGAADYLQTIWGYGVMLDEPVRRTKLEGAEAACA